MLAGYRGFDEQHIMAEVVWTKSSHWAHEREWRVYSGKGRSAAPYEDVAFNPMELDGIVFGARTSEGDRKALSEFIMVNYPHVEMLEARVRADTYGLTIEPRVP